MRLPAKVRALLVAVALLAASACSRPGINAGERGGLAFIAFAAMLVIMIAVLAIFLGKED